MESKAPAFEQHPGAVEGLLAAIVENSDDAIVGKNLDGVILSWNRAAEKIFGYAASEAIGRSIALIIPEERIHEMRAILGAVGRGVRIDHHETRRRRKDGRIIDVALTVSPIRDSAGTIVGASKIARDITEVKRVREEIERKAAQLQTYYVASTLLGSTLEVAAIYARLRELVAKVMECDALIVSDRTGGGEIRTRYAWMRDEPAHGTDLRLLANDLQASRHRAEVASGGTAQILGGIRASTSTGTALEGSLMIVPMKFESSVIGVVEIWSLGTAAYSREDLELLEGLVNQMTLATRNAELYQRAAQSAEEFALLANSMPQLAWALDASGEVDFVNRRYLEYTGLDDRNSSRDAFQRIVHPDDWNAFSRSYDASFAKGRTFEHELRLRNQRGEWRWHLSRIVPVTDADGKIFRWFGTGTDIHDRKEAEALAEREQDALRKSREALAKLNEDLEKIVEERTRELTAANAELEGFTYSVSHDLRAPLRAIVSSSMIVLHDFGEILPEDAQAHLRRQAAAAKKLATLIDDLLQYSRLGRKALVRQPVSLSAIAHGIAEDLGRRFPDREVEWRIQPGLEEHADPDLAGMLLQNLLDNAFKFTVGREHAFIEVGRDEQGYFVRDNGVGFEMQYVDKLFRPFERLHRDAEYEGTGIGLANVMRIVERHGGKASAEGALSKGATFRFTLGPPVSPIRA